MKYSNKKIGPVVTTGPITTQTQNKTRQNYYAIMPIYATYIKHRFMHIHIHIPACGVLQSKNKRETTFVQ